MFNKKNINLFLAIISLLLSGYTAAQNSNALVYAKHVMDTKTGIKKAQYQYEIQNASKNNMQQLKFGCYQDNTIEIVTQFTFEIQNNGGEVPTRWSKTITPLLPPTWTFEISKVEGEYDYCFEIQVPDSSSHFIPAGKSTTQTGQKFIFQLMKLDPKYANAYIRHYSDDPIIKARPFDTIPPNFSFTVTTHSHPEHKTGHGHMNSFESWLANLNPFGKKPTKSDKDAYADYQKRQGWTQIIMTPKVKDNYDPLPVVLLTSVNSTDKTMKTEDVDAVLNEETHSFWVRSVPNRLYTIKYTAIDASGNKTEVAREVRLR